MFSTAIDRTWQQLLHPRFRGVFFTSVAAAIATLIGLNYALYSWWPDDYKTGYDWLDSAGFWSVSMIGSYLLFPALVTMVMGLFVDKIADAVEEEYYPHRRATRDVSIGDTLWGATRLMLAMILLNFLAAFPYLLLFFTTAALGTIALFLLINGYLLGREYFEMVAVRHLPLKNATKMRRLYRGKVFTAGAMIAGLFMVPFLNILAPIIGAALMTHVFHSLVDNE